MSIPANITVVTVRGTYTLLNGSAATGSLSFQPSVSTLTDSALRVTILAKAYTVGLDANGSFSVDLPATNDPAVSPTGWTYTVTENFDGTTPRTYSIQIPTSYSGPGMDITQVTPTTSYQGTPLVNATALGQLTDVNIPATPGTAYVLQYDGTQHKWVAAAATGGISQSYVDTSIATANTANRNRANHTGTQSADTLTDGSNNRLYGTAEKNKLSGIATGATLNSPDSYLVNRANHSGVQSGASISDSTMAVTKLITSGTPLPTNVLQGDYSWGNPPAVAVPFDPTASTNLASVDLQNAVLELAGKLDNLSTVVSGLSAPPRARVAWAQVTASVPPAPPVETTSFPGYPGAGKCYLGQASSTYSTDWFDRRIWSGDGSQSAPAKLNKTVRVYESAMIISGTTLITNYVNQGRIPQITFHNGPYTAAQIAAGNADADLMTNFTFLRSLAGPVWVSYFHEPENNFGTAALQKDYRAAYRHIIDLEKSISGTTNIAWVKPYFVCPFDFQSKDYRVWDPEWNDAATDWVRTSAGVRKNYCDILGIDFYMPAVKTAVLQQTSLRNYTWDAKYTNQVLKTYKQTGGRPMPVVIGELGVLAAAAYPYLDDNGITASYILNEIQEAGIANQEVIGICMWNNSSWTLDDGHDVKLNPGDALGERTTALRAIARGMVLRDTSGNPVTSTTPKANYRWVAGPSNRIVSI